MGCMSTQTITEFLEARIREDERWAGEAFAGPWAAGSAEVESREGRVADVDGYGNLIHITRHDPARVLAECAAKRAIIKECRHSTLDDLDSGADDQPAPMWVARALAAVYADHAEFQQEWKL